MSFNDIFAALNGDEEGVIKSATGRFKGMKNAAIRTVIFPELRTLIVCLIGTILGALWLGIL